MRPPRVVIAVAFFVTTVFLTFLSLRSSHPSHTITTASDSSGAGIQSFFSFRAPFSLFPPNAIITLTHDNTTAFLARPAAFGPSLPLHGLKGQLWIGSGFGDDSIRQGPITTGAEGELGCSDAPGWVDTFPKSTTTNTQGANGAGVKSAKAVSKTNPQRRSETEDGPFNKHIATTGETSEKKAGGSSSPADDGTDDYLHRPLPEVSASETTHKQSVGPGSDHADIQSIQEGAEITGKVVLLSRGGCGFLEKVKWAQRRGAIALIVGDNTQGGPLIQMYARGDTSGVSIPSIFTSRTTAHLLSSLIGPGSFIEDTIDENGKPLLKVKHSDARKAPKAEGKVTAKKTTVTERKASKTSNRKGATRTAKKPSAIATEKPGWLKSLVFGVGKGSGKSDSSRPPSSGELDWILVDDWKDEVKPKKKKAPPVSPKSDSGRGSSSKAKTGDDFLIGVQDWRDPDLVGSKDVKSGGVKDSATDSKSTEANPSSSKNGANKLGNAQNEPSLRGGSITPGSGEYSTKNAVGDLKDNNDVKDSATGGRKPKSLLTTIFGDDEENVDIPVSSTSVAHEAEGDDGGENDEYEGLWVTLTPTSGASPFLDTLLVLVVSPLVTLTVVYALLLIRSRIRRRRWRAPKSVVERLPVRTYQTIVASGRQSPRTPSPTSSSVTTPLLQHSTPSRPRPRSRTTTGIPEPGDLMRVSSSPLEVPGVLPRQPEHEKNASVSSEWKKYMSKQIECVVCLEEYVDGVSRVMSLPCGHEFHVDCITPWLTTRRRTCPICKGDVVRSLARGSPSSPRYEAYHDDSDDDIQAQAAQTVNNSSSSALPITGVTDEDLEQGVASTPRPQSGNRASSWRSMLASSLGSSSRSRHPPQQDRNR